LSCEVKYIVLSYLDDSKFWELFNLLTAHPDDEFRNRRFENIPCGVDHDNILQRFIGHSEDYAWRICGVVLPGSRRYCTTEWQRENNLSQIILNQFGPLLEVLEIDGRYCEYTKDTLNVMATRCSNLRSLVICDCENMDNEIFDTLGNNLTRQHQHLQQLKKVVIQFTLPLQDFGLTLRGFLTFLEYLSNTTHVEIFLDNVHNEFMGEFGADYLRAIFCIPSLRILKFHQYSGMIENFEEVLLEYGADITHYKVQDNNDNMAMVTYVKNDG
jgi:hypothetical protein